MLFWLFVVPLYNFTYTPRFNFRFLPYGGGYPLIISCGISVAYMSVLEGKEFIHFTAPMTSRDIMIFGIRPYGIECTIHINRCFNVCIYLSSS